MNHQKRLEVSLGAAILTTLLVLSALLYTATAQDLSTASGAEETLVPITNGNVGDVVEIMRLRSRDMIMDIAWSPDGSTLAVSRQTNTWLYDAANLNAEPREMARHRRERIRALAYSPDGTTIASSGHLRPMHLWDVLSGDALMVFEDSIDVANITFSPDGTTIASARFRQMRLHNVANGQVIASLPGHTGDVNSIAFSPDGTTIASASSDGTVRLWNVGTGQELAILQGHRAMVNAVAFSPDGATIASASSDSTVRLWDAASGQMLNVLEGTMYGVMDVTFSPDGTVVASTSWGGVQLWDAVSGQLLTILLEDDTSFLGDVSFSPDGTALTFTSSDNTVYLWGVIGRQVTQENTLVQAVELIGADNLEMLNATGEGQIIVVIDSGIETSHPFLSGKIIDEACFSERSVVFTSLCPSGNTEEFGPGSSMPSQCFAEFGAGNSICGHGTRVAGIATGSSDSFRGVAPNAQIISINAASFGREIPGMSWPNCDGERCYALTLQNVLRSLEWIEKHERVDDIASVIISLADYSIISSGHCDINRPSLLLRVLNPNDYSKQQNQFAIQESVSRLKAMNIAVVVASGNIGIADSSVNNPTGIAFPACLRDTISVGATQVEDDQIAKDFSMSAPILDLLAPGDKTFEERSDGIFSPTLLGEYNEMSGTSFAAPFVAGAIAAIRSQVPDASVTAILGALQCTGEELEDDRYPGVKTSRIRVDIALGALRGTYHVRSGDLEALELAERAIALGCGGDTITMID